MVRRLKNSVLFSVHFSGVRCMCVCVIEHLNSAPSRYKLRSVSVLANMMLKFHYERIYCIDQLPKQCDSSWKESQEAGPHTHVEPINKFSLTEWHGFHSLCTKLHWLVFKHRKFLRCKKRFLHFLLFL